MCDFRFWRLLAILSWVLMCGSCGPPTTADDHAGVGSGLSGQLVLTGSSTIAPLATELGKRFETLHSGVRIDVQSGGSSRGIADARNGLADIGMVSRDLKDNERDLLAFPIARDGICMIVHRDNPIVELSDKQIVAIYTDQINDWQSVGGDDARITVVNKAEGRSTLELFLHYFKLDATAVIPDIVIGENEHGIKTVAGNPHAIAYVSIGTAEFSASQGVPIKLLSIGGVAAATDNVRDGRFPLSRTLNLVTNGDPPELARAFIDFAQSAEAAPLIEEQYFVPPAH